MASYSSFFPHRGDPILSLDLRTSSHKTNGDCSEWLMKTEFFFFFFLKEPQASQKVLKMNTKTYIFDPFTLIRDGSIKIPSEGLDHYF